VKLSAAAEQRAVPGDEASSDGEITIGERIISWANLPVRADGRVEGRLIVLREVTSERQLALLREEVGHMMVHDLRSPLTALSGSLGLLKSDSALDEDGTALASAAESSAAKMLTLVNGLLDLYKLESGLPDLRRSPIGLRDLVRAQLAGLRATARAGGVVLDEQVLAGLVIDVDAELIGRVIQNLVANAISYAPPGSVVRIEASADGDGVRLAVTDGGTGVAAAVQPRLFQKFASTRKGGTGLGLAFCRLAVEAHGGRIWYEPALPTGSTFQFVIANPVPAGPHSRPGGAG
ncbi:MAG: ATP-binding protein, partial [Acidobacteriota bacterium]|nr:ATP-binding protein [Acidobacteriota bacterium]